MKEQHPVASSELAGQIIEVMAPTVRCPICKKEVALDDPNMPFCSDRCRIIDVGNWASEKYVISTPVQQGDLEETDLEESKESDHAEGRSR